MEGVKPLVPGAFLQTGCGEDTGDRLMVLLPAGKRQQILCVLHGTQVFLERDVFGQAGDLAAGGIVGALAGGQGAELGRRRGGRAGVLALNLTMGAVTATIGVIAIALNVPNEIRGLALGTNVFVSAVFGVATAPSAIALLSQALGGEAMLGQAIAGVSFPSSLLAAFFFLLAMRGARRTGIVGATA
ncbi:major facilitator superfamily protein [Sphingomonas sp. LH128]|uniref:hypothetical protein n=1 Tax=Sphingomonas sp. LH128 TaxID=473781 RepID=UPI00027C9B03|nr:hypothetical protein [Sphingomonas sp. LH128]EJU14770.1 major facilitator superfamily protein [Sphingomonas sp. LH128]